MRSTSEPLLACRGGRRRRGAKGGAGIALAWTGMTRAVVSTFAVSLVTTLLSTPLAKKAALKLRLVDQPSGRKVHTSAVPYLGGLAIIAGLFASLTSDGLADHLSTGRELGVILGGAVAMSLMGLWDDWKVVPGWIKVPVELSLGGLLFLSGARAEIFGFWPVDFVITVAWVIGVTNAVNYIDNMDGLSAGVVALAGFYFTFLAASSGQGSLAALSAGIAGSALGFLWYNRAPAKIFMGDTGSLFLGFLLAGLGLELRFDNLGGGSFLVPVSVMALPVVDALLVSVSRTMRGLSPIHPGKDHISHRLTALGLAPVSAVRLLWLVGAACGGLGLLMSRGTPFTAYVLTACLGLVWIILALLLLKVRVE